VDTYDDSSNEWVVTLARLKLTGLVKKWDNAQQKRIYRSPPRKNQYNKLLMSSSSSGGDVKDDGDLIEGADGYRRRRRIEDDDDDYLMMMRGGRNVNDDDDEEDEHDNAVNADEADEAKAQAEQPELLRELAMRQAPSAASVATFEADLRRWRRLCTQRASEARTPRTCKRLVDVYMMPYAAAEAGSAAAPAAASSSSSRQQQQQQQQPPPAVPVLSPMASLLQLEENAKDLRLLLHCGAFI
jgi:hypothetical protein